MEIKRKQINGINISLYNEKEEKAFEGVYKQIKHLESYITNISIQISLGEDEVVIEFNNQFKVEFDTDNYMVKKIETTFSNQKVNKSFIELAKKLYEL